MVPKGDAKPGAVKALRDMVAPRGGETLHPHPVPRPGHLVLCLSSLGTESRAGMLLTPIQTPRCWSIPCEHRSSADVFRGQTPLWPRISTPRGLTLLARAPKPHPHPRDPPRNPPQVGQEPAPLGTAYLEAAAPPAPRGPRGAAGAMGIPAPLPGRLFKPQLLIFLIGFIIPIKRKWPGL